MKNKLTSKMTLSNWKDVPIFNKRLATKDDVDNYEALFTMINTEGKLYQIDLPFCAKYTEEKTGKKTSVVAIQAEAVGNEIIIGVIQVNGETLVCTLSDLELIIDPDETFFKENQKNPWWKFWGN